MRPVRSHYYGSICVYRKAVEFIQGYNEAFEVWGADDDDLRRRLRRVHLSELRVEDAKAIHIEIKPTRPVDQPSINPTLPFNPQPEWGTDF